MAGAWLFASATTKNESSMIIVIWTGFHIKNIKFEGYKILWQM